MTAEPLAALPLLPTEPQKPGLNAGPKAQHAPARPREAPAPPPEPRSRRDWRLPASRAVSGVLSGASVVQCPPPPISGVWAKHAASARYYGSPLMRWPRFAYGAWHAFVEVPVLYFLAWAGDSLPKRLAVLAVIVGTLRLLGVHIIWSWL